jgi:hypothetical protein
VTLRVSWRACARVCDRSGSSVPAFADSMYQWASTLTQSGANFPTALPLKVDKLETGFTVRISALGGRQNLQRQPTKKLP